jgi:hypothetical protein
MLNTHLKQLVSVPSGEKLMALFDLSDFKISPPQCPTHYSPAGNGDVLDIVVRQNIRVSDVTVSDILDSDHLPKIFHMLDHVKIRNISELCPPERTRPCDLQKIINSLKLRKSCGIDGIPNECLRHLPRRPLVYLTQLFNHCLKLSHFPKSWKEEKS